jgi:hypothetical protein
LFASFFVLWSVFRCHVVYRQVYHVKRVANLVSDSLSQSTNRGLSLGGVQFIFKFALRLEPRDHFVERARKLPYFVAPLNIDLKIEIASGDTLSGARKLLDRAGEAPADYHYDCQREQQKPSGRQQPHVG